MAPNELIIVIILTVVMAGVLIMGIMMMCGFWSFGETDKGTRFRYGVIFVVCSLIALIMVGYSLITGIPLSEILPGSQ